MSGPAQNDIAAIRQIDLCLSGSERKIAAAGQQGGGAPVFSVVADRPGNGNIVSRETPDCFLACGRVGWRGLCCARFRLTNQQGYDGEQSTEDCALPVVDVRSSTNEFQDAHIRVSARLYYSA